MSMTKGLIALSTLLLGACGGGCSSTPAKSAPAVQWKLHAQDVLIPASKDNFCRKGEEVVGADGFKTVCKGQVEKETCTNRRTGEVREGSCASLGL